MQKSKNGISLRALSHFHKFFKKFSRLISQLKMHSDLREFLSRVKEAVMRCAGGTQETADADLRQKDRKSVRAFKLTDYNKKSETKTVKLL